MRSQRELFYDGKQVTLFTPAQKYYATVAFDGSLGDLANALQAKYGVDLPLADLFVLGTPAATLDKLDSAMNAGRTSSVAICATTMPCAKATSTGRSGSPSAATRCRASW